VLKIILFFYLFETHVPGLLKSAGNIV